MANAIVIELKADDKGSLEIKRFAKNIDDLDKTAHRTSGGGIKRLADSMFTLRGAFAGLVGYFSGRAIWRGLTSIFSEFMNAEKALKQFNLALATTGRWSAGLSKYFVDLSSSIQKVTAYGDEAVLSISALLAQMTNLAKQGLEKATKGVIGLAAVLGTDLQTAGLAVSKALMGNVGALSRYGIQVKETLSQQGKQASILRQLLPLFERAKGEAQTQWGAVEQLKNAWGDYKEMLGETLSEIMRFVKGIEVLKGAVEGLQQMIWSLRDKRKQSLRDEISSIDAEVKKLTMGGSQFVQEQSWSSMFLSAITGKSFTEQVDARKRIEELTARRSELVALLGGLEKKPESPLPPGFKGVMPEFKDDTAADNKLKQQQEQYRDLLRSVFAERPILAAANEHESELAKINKRYDELIQKVSEFDKLSAVHKKIAITAIEHNRELEKQNQLLKEQKEIYTELLKTWQKVADIETDALQKLADSNIKITDQMVDTLKLYAEKAPWLVDPYLEKMGVQKDNTQGIAALGKLFGVSAGPIMGKEFWTSFKKEWAEGGFMGKLGALGNLASNMMGLFEMGKGAPSQGYAVAGGAVTGAVSGASLATTLGAGAWGAAGGAVGGAILGAGIAAWGAAEEKKKAAEERRAQRQAEADKYSAEFKSLAEEGFYPTFGTSISGGMWQSSKEQMDRYLGLMKNLSKQLSEAIANAFNDAMNSPTLASAMESFSEKFAEGTGSIIVSQSSEIGARMIKTMFAPAFQGIDEVTYYFEQQWSEATQQGKDDLAGMFNQAITPARQGFEFLTAMVGKIDAAIGALIGTVAPRLGTAVTAALDIAFANSGMMIVSRLVMKFGALIGDLITTLQKKFEKSWGFIIEAAWRLSRDIEKKFDLEADWIKELRKAGIELTDDMGKDMVNAMKDAWSDLRKTITSSLEEAFNAYTISGGWRTFQDKMKEGIRDFIVKGLANALVAGGILMGAIGPFIKDIVKLFAKSLKGGFDVSEFGRIIEGITQNVDTIMGSFLPIFEKLFPMIEGLNKWASGTGGITSAEVGADLSLFGQQKQQPETTQTWGSGDEALNILSGLFSGGLFAGSPVLGSGWDFPVLSKLADAINSWSWPTAAALAAALAAWQWPILSALAAALNVWQMPILTLLATALKNWDFPILTLLTSALNAWKFPILDTFIRALNAWKFPIINSLILALNAWSFPILSQFTLALKSWNFPVLSTFSNALTFFGNTIVNLIIFWNNLLTQNSGSSGTGGAGWLSGPTGGGYINSYATGTDYVPRTGTYLLHQGEAVVPAGSGRSITVKIENINISGNASAIDAKRIARELGYEIEMAMRSIAT